MKVNTRRVISVLLALLMLCSNMVFARENDFAGHWAQEAIKTWTDKGYVKGYPDGSFKPDNEITRAELISIVNRSFEFTQETDIDYKNVADHHWAYNELKRAKAAGYIAGFEDGTLRPNNQITRQEIAAIIARLTGLKEAKDSEAFLGLDDLDIIPEWSAGVVSAVVDKGYMKLRDGNSFAPALPATRAEVIDALDKSFIGAIKVKYDKAGTYTAGVVKGSVEINAKDVILEDTIIHGNLIIGEAVGDGNVTLRKVRVKGETIVKGGGMNSIIIENSQISHIIIEKVGGKVRILAKGSTSVASVEMKSGGKLESDHAEGENFGYVVIAENIPLEELIILAGNFESIEVKTASNKVEVQSGTVKNLKVAETAKDAKISLAVGVKVEKAEVNAPAKIEGKGQIKDADINVNGVEMMKPTGTVKEAEGVKVEETKPAPSTGGGNETTTPVVKVSAITDITGTAKVGEVLNAGTTIPADATVTYQWTISDAAGGTYTNIVGATSNTYTPVAGDATKFIKVKATGTGSYSGTVTSVATGAVVAADPIQLTIAEPSLTITKEYDGNTTTEVTAGVVTGVVGDDDVTVDATATYDNKSVGTNKTITVVYTLTGADAAKYVAPVNYEVTNGVITAAPSTDATLTSTIGTVDDGAETIVDVPNVTTLADFKAAITPATDASFEVYEADGTTVATDLQDGYKVIVTAEDGTTKTYTINFTVENATNESYFTIDEDGKLKSYSSEGPKDVVIPKTIDGVDVTSIGKSSFSNKNLTSVIIPDSVTSISNQAFYINKIESVTLSKNLTSIGIWAFAKNMLSSVTIPRSVTTVEQSTFKNNGPNSESGGIPKTDFVGIWEILQGSNDWTRKVLLAEVKAYAQSLNTDDYLDFSRVTGALAMNENTDAEKIDKARAINSAIEQLVRIFEFKNNTETGGLTLTEYNGTDTDVSIPEVIDGVQVTSIGPDVFKNKGLTSVTIPGSVKSIGMWAFYNNELTSVELPENLTTLFAYAFYKNKLTSVTIPENLTSITTKAFSENALTSIEIPDSVTSIDVSAFSKNKLKSVTLSKNLTNICAYAFLDNSLTSISMPNTVEDIGDQAFCNNNMETIVMSNNLTNIGKWAFDNNLLTSVTIPEKIENIGENAFRKNGPNRKSGNIAIQDGQAYPGTWILNDEETPQWIKQID